MIKLPKDIQQEIKTLIYKKADAHGYLFRDRIANGIFISNLVKDIKIGGRLADFIPKPDIKTYIKDAVLNRYSKDKLRIPQDVAKELSAALKTKASEFEYNKKNNISIYKTDESRFVVVARGTYLKWETALRKALEYIGGAPGLRSATPQIVLMLASQADHPPKSDREYLAVALEGIGVVPVFYECLGA